MRLYLTSVPLLLSLSASCGNDDKDNPDDPIDSGVAVVDAMVVVADAEPDYCTVLEASYGDLGALTGTAVIGPQDSDMPTGPKLLSLQIPLNQDATPDVFFVELWDGEAEFLDGYSAQTIMLSMDNSDLVLCTSCAYIAADYTVGGLKDFHMTYSGQLVIDSVDPTPGTGRIVGSLTNLKLHAVTVDQAGQEITDMGCKLTLEKISFDFPITAAPVASE